MKQFPPVQLSTVPQHIKVLRVGNNNANAYSQMSTTTEERTDPTTSVLTLSHLSKSKVFPSDHVQPKLLSFSSSPATQSMDHIDRSSTVASLSIKLKRFKMLVIGLGILLGICALAALAIGLYFIINNSTKTTSTTTTTTAACTLELCWDTSGTTALGTGSSGASSDHLNNPYHLVIDASGSFYITDYGNNRIQKFTASSVMATTVAGQANDASGTGPYYFNQPTYVLVDSSGNMYVADSSNHRVQYFASGSMLGVTIAGNGSFGPALNQLNSPHGLAFDSNRGILYISDMNNHRIMSYSSGAVFGTVVAGGNGQGTLSNQLDAPMGIHLDVSSNSLYIANNNAHNIICWVVNASTWTLIAGNGNGQAGHSSTTFTNPTDVTFDYMGNMYVADSGNDRIQLFLSGNSNGTTIAGITSVSASTANTLDVPQSLALDSNLNLYVVDSGNNRIQKFQRQ